ncbi:hypothetical protein [uncultured Sphingomonas sp.]|uniref:hypothetical protein n=1 Tax=uncultured Sphingomonas sp. TaxID=158754 RepID=UPI0025D4980E|nr:hypothetical protein [uncultured Sphingomonas sp.]
MALSYQKARAAIADGDVLMVTQISEPASAAGTFYCLKAAGKPVTKAAARKLMPELAPAEDGLFPGASQTYALA